MYPTHPRLPTLLELRADGARCCDAATPVSETPQQQSSRRQENHGNIVLLRSAYG